MKNLLVILFCLPIIIYAQINVGNDQIICLGDTAEITAYLPSGSQGVGRDTVICGIHTSNYTSTLTRGFYFQAQSSFKISGLMCATDNSGLGFNQSVQFVAFGDSVNGIWNSYPPVSVANGANFTTLFSSIDDTTANYISCNISVDSGQYYGVIGARHVAGAGSTGGQLYNSYSATTGATVTIDGQITLLSRLYYQDNLAVGVGLTGSFLAQTGGGGQVGRVHMLTGGGVEWFDVNSGQSIGGGDTLLYSPSQSTLVAGMITDSLNQVYSDTMYLDVLNTSISSTGQSLCNGPLVLNVPSGFASYNWIGGASTSSSLTVTTAGVYSVECISSSGQICQSAPMTIYSGNIPISLSTPDSLFICQGDIVTIDGPPGYSQYAWSNGATTPSISVTTPGTYSLVVTDANGCTGISGTTTIEIFPQSISLAVSGGFSLCNGNTPILDAGAGYASYDWYRNNNLIPSVTSPSYTVTTAGDYFVNVVYPTGCTATSDTITIFPATAQFYFSISTIGPDSLCLPGGQMVLDAGPYASFSWSPNTGSATTRQVTINSLGTYYVNVTDSNGCSGVSNPAFTAYNIVNTSGITGTPLPPITSPRTYSVVYASGSTYSWNVTGGTIQSGQGTNSVDVSWTAMGSGSISVTETDINGCIGDPVTLSVSIGTTSLEEIKANKILYKITNVLGEETLPKSNTPLFYIYKDGTVEKQIIIE